MGNIRMRNGKYFTSTAFFSPDELLKPCQRLFKPVELVGAAADTLGIWRPCTASERLLERKCIEKGAHDLS